MLLRVGYRETAAMEVVTVSLLVIVVMVTTVTTDVATSGYKLAIVVEKEGRLVDVLERYVTVTLANHSYADEAVQRFLTTIKEERSNIRDIVGWVGHPINAFHLVDRTVNGWSAIQQTINCSTCQSTMATQDFNSAWKRITNEYGIWTSSEDLNIARTGLERLHQVYSFDLKEMITGTIYNLTTSPLTIGDVISITKALAVEKRIKWYEAFLELDSVTEKKSILYKLAIDYHMTGMSRKALDILTDLQKTSTRPMGSLINMIRQKAESSKQTVDQENSELTEEDIMDNTYRQLCQGLIQRDVYEPALFCYHTETNIPYYRIKEEVLSYIPRISRFHDIISDSEIAHLQITVKQNLKRARVWHKGVAVYVDSRTGESAQVKKTITCVKLEKRIELITGLDLADRQEIKTAETLHVVNYGIGGHYERHYDFFDVRNSPDKTHGSQNDRIATWMFYLNNVKAGGATVFPKINLRILPIKGSAVLWYNLLPSGEIDERSQHAACPVILGTKWVSTKWVREFGQELRKPCGLHPMAEHS